MDPKTKINYMLIAIVVVAMQVIGALWYSPFLFGNLWAKILGVDPTTFPKTIGSSPYILSILGSLLLCMVLNHIVVLTKTKTMVGGIKLAMLLWMGFVLTVLAPHYAFMGFSRLIFIDVGKDFVAMVVAGAILASGQE